MSILTKMIFIVLISSVASFANAGFHMEPYVGHKVAGKWEEGTSKDDVKLTNFGIKLGYQAPAGFQVGGDIQLGSGTYDNIPGSGATELDAASAAFGAYIGYQSEMGLRGYAHYLFASALVFDAADDPTFTGSGFKLGVGYSVLPWLALNLEYHAMTYDKYKDNLVSDLDLDPKHKDNFLFFIVSFPFNFGGR